MRGAIIVIWGYPIFLLHSLVGKSS